MEQLKSGRTTICGVVPCVDSDDLLNLHCHRSLYCRKGSSTRKRFIPRGLCLPRHIERMTRESLLCFSEAKRVKIRNHLPNNFATILVTPNLTPGGDHHSRLSHRLKDKALVLRPDRILDVMQTFGLCRQKSEDVGDNKSVVTPSQREPANSP